MDSVSFIGDINIHLDRFDNLDYFLNELKTKSFKATPSLKLFRLVNEKLVNLIQNSLPQVFLLAAVIDYIDKINTLKILKENYHFSHFEFWLNSYVDITPQEKYIIRAKIAGQHFPREDYQAFFPIGMGNYFTGTHYVAAHLSPDIDTTVASFWGWLDAFAAQVCDGLHLWSLPGGPPESPVTQLFNENFGTSFFSTIARKAGTLTLSAIDLVSTHNFIKAKGGVLANTLTHGIEEKAIVLVDENGHYLGDWRSSDVEPIRQIIILFNLCLGWLETNIHTHLISLFTKDSLNADEIKPLVSSLFDLRIEECEPVINCTEQPRQQFEGFLTKILGISKGLRGTFYELTESLKERSLLGLSQFYEDFMNLSHSEIFDINGALIEDRPQIFSLIQRLINRLDIATHMTRAYLERLDIAIKIKHQVLEKDFHYLTYRNDVEDIKLKMANYSYLTVVFPEDDGLLYPIGIVWANNLRKSILGTVSFRDFCNSEEVKMASYLSVISVVDHHKTSLKTNTPPLAIISDAQSCNVLVAELSMELNDRYSTAGMEEKDIYTQIEDIRTVNTANQARLLQRLLKRLIAIENRGDYFVHPWREFTEYLYFIHAILDDTDLLTKISGKDVYCVVNLLNRLKTLAVKKEMEVISLDDLPKDQSFCKAAAKRILTHPDMYSIYKKIYVAKENEVSKNIELSIKGLPSPIFLDTKEQNGCCRVGQTKLFSSNYPLFDKHRCLLQDIWLKKALNIYTSKPEIDFHLQMISTIASADDVYNETQDVYSHEDELWFWLPETEQAQGHLAIFLSAFQRAAEVKKQKMWLEIRGKNATSWQEIFNANFSPLNKEKTKILESDRLCLILRFKAGTLNSRKSMITPYLPLLVP